MIERERTWLVGESVLGGRIDSLLDPAGREWLRKNPDPGMVAARAAVRSGDPFVDAGGWEECFPTLSGAFDHGDVWSRTWKATDSGLTIARPGYRLSRMVTVSPGGVLARYRLEAAPGFQFIWTAHLLLALTESARLQISPGVRCRVWPDHWRQNAPEMREGSWPAPLGAPLDALATDSTALFFMLLEPGMVSATDGESLSFELLAPGQPTALAVWRNLGGWPEANPYRSIGIEPTIGHHFDRDLARPDELGVVGSTGVLEWTLQLTICGTDQPGY